MLINIYCYWDLVSLVHMKIHVLIIKLPYIMVFIYPNEVLNYIFQMEGCLMILCLKCGISIAMNEMKIHESPQKKVLKVKDFPEERPIVVYFGGNKGL